MILDAIIAALIFKFWGDNGLIILMIVCAVTFLRLAGRVNAYMDAFEYDIENNEEVK